MSEMSDLMTVADILVKHRGSLDTSELTRLTAAREILNTMQATIIEQNTLLTRILMHPCRLPQRIVNDIRAALKPTTGDEDE